ncbi:MAG TPA: response regulator [Bdellovibrionales bacterium]|nr:response regulator [Bdellovibrionales bacterium]
MAESPRSRVLIVEDDEMLRGTLESVLSAAGFTVTAASNGREGLAALAEASYSFILSDVKMPQMDGLALLRAFKEKAYAGRFVIMTGYSEYTETAGAQSLGADALLQKPFRRSDLFRLMESLKLV